MSFGDDDYAEDFGLLEGDHLAVGADAPYDFFGRPTRDDQGRPIAYDADGQPVLLGGPDHGWGVTGAEGDEGDEGDEGEHPFSVSGLSPDESEDEERKSTRKRKAAGHKRSRDPRVPAAPRVRAPRRKAATAESGAATPGAQPARSPNLPDELRVDGGQLECTFGVVPVNTGMCTGVNPNKVNTNKTSIRKDSNTISIRQKLAGAVLASHVTTLLPGDTWYLVPSLVPFLVNGVNNMDGSPTLVIHPLQDVFAEYPRLFGGVVSDTIETIVAKVIKRILRGEEDRALEEDVTDFACFMKLYWSDVLRDGGTVAEEILDAGVSKFLSPWGSVVQAATDLQGYVHDDESLVIPLFPISDLRRQTLLCILCVVAAKRECCSQLSNIGLIQSGALFIALKHQLVELMLYMKKGNAYDKDAYKHAAKAYVDAELKRQLAITEAQTDEAQAAAAAAEADPVFVSEGEGEGEGGEE